ncbi:UDP-N-acetylmuramoyl-tripeptide--D-alanyl-D-alanine ligase [Leptospira inadai serovar Lyme str. 10]|uniref:UDP-N-acetylmuramoyl-tripeptide--D-alanyl-D-alanine ligase n=2 Tax=Leptospira inadai serovar Lyme TaxID=293084 RepID=V6HNK0_9LEPT|nr:UDP-N-acetylmuramoyl-tripeptide--D-alanyl-D-alanine ligase [Leptospira inadai]EQA38465.1 UDP-N-acetylmuramoyl-tripeptide--D-alanyl-D-alanine ligase [Leptospira inadai serovar Lyme str. 10]PNV74258.1 UDP-N-acetylmuramoyl-tripeptide--D-alanyl-D-alanine ligase [Leptospira inadai serovar Lyme]
MRSDFRYDPETVRRILSSPSKVAFLKESEILSITTSSGMCESDSLFVPLRGNRDGHDFIPDALSKGATYFLCEYEHPILEKLSEADREKAIFVKDTLIGLGKLAAFHRSRFKPIVIAVTGSSGKTTTKEILGSCLSPLEESLVVTERNYNNEIGVPFTLFRIGPKTRYVICEMGMNTKDEISRLSSMAKPQLSIITTIGTAHIEFFRSRKGIAKAKAEVMDGMPKSGIVFYPATGEYKRVLSKKARKSGVKFTLVPLTSRIKTLETLREGFRLEIFSTALNWNLPGSKLLENLSLCIAALEEIGTPEDWILEGIRNFKTKDKRLDLQEGTYRILNDTYNANRESMLSSLEACSQLSGTEGFYAILGDMKEVGSYSSKFHAEVGKFAASLSNCKGIFTFGSGSHFIFKGFQSKAKPPQIAASFSGDEEGLHSLLEEVKKNVQPGSYILAKASRGMKLERVVEALNSNSKMD